MDSVYCNITQYMYMNSIPSSPVKIQGLPIKSMRIENVERLHIIYFICVYQDWILHLFVNTENSMYMHSISILNKWVSRFAYMYILSYNRNIYLIIALVYLKVVEGAAGTALGAYLKNPGRFKGKRVVLIACGGNLGIQTLKQLVSMYT